MRAPRLRHRLALESPEPVADGAGGLRSGWVLEGYLWADVRPGVLRRAPEEPGDPGELRARILLRAAGEASPQRPRPGQRLRQDGRLWHILAVTAAEEGDRYLAAHVREEIQP